MSNRATGKTAEQALDGLLALRCLEHVHGSRCSCRLLAVAMGADPSSVEYSYCKHVLQRHWRVICDHIPTEASPKVTPMLPPHDPRDPIHALLVANADLARG